MDEFKIKITNYLKQQGISKSYVDVLDKLYNDKLITENMPYDAVLAFFLLHMSHTNPMFNNILKKKYLFDLVCVLKTKNVAEDVDQIHAILTKRFEHKVEYIHIEPQESNLKFCIKYNSKIYSPLKNECIQDYLIPYHLLLFNDKLTIDDFIFTDILFTPQPAIDIKTTYAEFIEHLKTLDIPLQIKSDDLLFEDTSIVPIFSVFIYLPKNSQWPKDQDAIDCAKSAFYCQLYLKSKYREALTKEYCVFKYKNTHFKVTILLKSDVNVKHKVLTKVYEVVKGKGPSFYRKVLLFKTILGHLGLYPIAFDDSFVDILSLIIDKDFIGNEKFVKEILNFNYNLKNFIFDLETKKLYKNKATSTSKTLKIIYKDLMINIDLPSADVIEFLMSRVTKLLIPDSVIFSDTLALKTDKLLLQSFEDFDFVLARNEADYKNMKEILGIIPNEFDLGNLNTKYLVGNILSKMTTFFYNPILHYLMVKVNPGYDVELVKNLIINETSFEFIYQSKYN